MASSKDRRTEARLTVRVPVSLRSRETGLRSEGHTHNLSTNGVFLYTDALVSSGSEVEMVLMLPPELNHGQKGWVCCQASVLRVEDGGSRGEVALAAKIHSLQLLPEISD